MTGKEAIKKFMNGWGKKREQALTFRQQYDETFREIDSFIRGEQWNDVAKKDPWTPRPVNNILHLVQQAKLSKISESKIETKLLPLSSTDVEVVEKMESMMSSYWKHSGVQHVINDVKSDSRSFPIGYIKVAFDGTAIVGTQNNLQKGDFKFESLAPMNVYWDPRGYRTENMEFMYETKKVSLEDIKNTAKYDQDVVKDIEDYVNSLDVSNEDSGEVLNRNYDLESDNSDVFTLYVISFRWKSSLGADYKYGEIHTVSKGGGEDIENIPLWAKADLKIKRHPIIPLREFRNTHEFLGKSTVQIVLNKQKSVNRVDSIITNVATQLSNQQKIVSVSSGIDPKALAKYGNAAGLVLATKGDVNNSVSYIKPPEIPNSLIQYKKESKEDIYEVANITPASLGKSAGSITTAGGVNAMIGQSYGMESVPKSNYKLFIEKIYRTMLEYVVGNFKKVERRIDNHDPDKDVSFGFETFDIKEFKNKDFDMYIDVRATEAELQQQKQEVMQLLGLQAQMGVEIISIPTAIELLKFPDSDRLLAAYYEKQEKQKQEQEQAQSNQTKSQVQQAAFRAALLMAQEIEQNDGKHDNVSIQEMAKMAAQQVSKEIITPSEQSPGAPQQNVPQGNAIGGGQGAGAPQPAAQAALLQKGGQ